MRYQPFYLASVVVALQLGGCERAPAEPEPHVREAPAPTRHPLSWTAAPTWTVEHTSNRGSLRGRYSIPASGAAKSAAELLVMVLDKGGASELEAKLAELQSQFEGAHQIKRETLKVGDLEVQLLEVAGTYRMPMGPAMGKAKKHAAHVLKSEWRALAAGVNTPDRGTWMFRLLGPNDSVEAARGAFRAMVEDIR